MLPVITLSNFCTLGRLGRLLLALLFAVLESMFLRLVPEAVPPGAQEPQRAVLGGAQDPQRFEQLELLGVFVFGVELPHLSGGASWSLQDL